MNNNLATMKSRDVKPRRHSNAVYQRLKKRVMLAQLPPRPRCISNAAADRLDCRPKRCTGTANTIRTDRARMATTPACRQRWPGSKACPRFSPTRPARTAYATTACRWRAGCSQAVYRMCSRSHWLTSSWFYRRTGLCGLARPAKFTLARNTAW